MFLKMDLKTVICSNCRDKECYQVLPSHGLQLQTHSLSFGKEAWLYFKAGILLNIKYLKITNLILLMHPDEKCKQFQTL